MFFRITSNPLLALLALLSLSSTLTLALPMFGLRRVNGDSYIRHTALRRNLGHHTAPKHRRSDDHGDVAAHDAFEAKLHSLEAALRHYEEYGDQESLQTYLNGFAGDAHSDNGSKQSGAGGSSSGSNSKQGSGKQNGASEKDDCDENDQSRNTPPHQASQPKDQPKMQRHPKKMQPEPSNDYSAPKPQPQPQQPSMDHSEPEPKPQPKPQPEPQPEQPKPQPEQPKPQPQTPPEGYNPNAGSGGDSKKGKDTSNSNSINGYTPPAFSTSSSPSVSSLYTSAPFSGRATFYNTGLGACGIINNDNDPIVAVSKDLFEQYNPSSGDPNHNSLCGRKIEIRWQGKTVNAFATDECPGCASHSLDLSPTVFERLDNKDKGVLDGIQWRFV